MASRIADLMIKLGATDTELIKTFKKTEYQLGKLSRSLTSVGRTMSTTFTAPLTVMAGLSVKAADTQIKAEAKVAQAIKSTGQAAKLSLQELKDYASELQSNSLFGDEEILDKATAQLLTFTNIAGDEFKRTQAVALDLAQHLGGDLQSASIQLGKALNDPVANLSALSRSGIQFSEEQKEVIKMLAETNQLADAQNVILTELERQYGGQAKAAVTALGPTQQLSNVWGDFMEQIGARLLPFIEDLSNMLMGVVKSLQEMNPATLDTILVVAGLAAAIGPLSLGLGSVIKMLPLMASGLSAALSPIGLVATAVMGLAMAFVWARNKYNEAISAMAEESSPEELQRKLAENQRQQQQLKSQSSDRSIQIGGGSVLGGFSQTPNDDAIALQRLYKEEQMLTDAINKQEEARRRENAAKEESLRMEKEILASQTRARAEYQKTLALANQAQLTNAQAKQKSEGYDQSLITSPVAMDIDPGKTSDTFVKAMENTNSAMDNYIAGINNKRQEYSNALLDFELQMQQLMEQLENTTRQFVASSLVSIGEGIGQLASGDVGFDNLAMTLTQQFGNFISTLGKILIESALAMETFKKFISSLFTSFPAALVAGVALVATGTAIAAAANKKAQGAIPALANGGLAYGETYALIGDNPNARVDPEVVAPLSKLQQIMGNSTGSGQNISISLDGLFRLKSSDLQLAINKNNYRVSISK